MGETLEQIKEMLLELGDDKLKDVAQNLHSYNGCLDYLDYWGNDNEFFDTFFQTKDEAVRAVCYGDYTYTDEYVIINAYGNCDSVSEMEYYSLLEDSVDDIADNLVELWDEDVDDWLKNELPEELVNLINQYKGDDLESDYEDYKKGELNKKQEDIEAQEDIEDNEEENDINFDDTISLLDIALSEIPTVGVEDWGKDDELLFTADTKVMFENLKNYEEEIPKYYYDNASNDDWSNGIDGYLEEIKGVDLNSGDSDNTYNWNAPLTHDVEFTIYEADDGCYFKGSIHRAGDVRGNYTTEFLLKFNDKDDCLEALFDSCAGFCQREVKLENTTYVITPHFFNEYVDIYNLDTDETYDDVYCDCIERLKEIIAENKDSEE